MKARKNEAIKSPRKAAATAQNEHATASTTRRYKGNEKYPPQQAVTGKARRTPKKYTGMSTPEIVRRLPPMQKRVYDVLARGGRYTTGQLVLALDGYLCHAGGVIRDLRAAGIAVCDEWVNGKNARYKRYFLRKEG